MTDKFNKKTEIKDIEAAYYLLLGRKPEKFTVVEEKINRSIIDMAKDFVISEEFKLVSETVTKTGRLPHEHLPGKCYTAVAIWLRSLVPDTIAGSWWSMLHNFFVASQIETFEDSKEFFKFRQLVAERVEIEEKNDKHLQPFRTFNESWYLQFHEKARLALAGGITKSAADYFMTIGLADRQQLLPFFSEGYEQSYQEFLNGGEYVLDDVTTRMLSDARSGYLSHWLFSGSYYRDTLEWRRDTNSSLPRGPQQESELFLDFLTCGDAKGHSPHPLFNHLAYSILNPSTAMVNGTTFYDYVLDGAFSGRRTSVLFDDEYYLSSNADARYALLTGSHICALHHFLAVGIYRNLPFSPDFDLQFYLGHYPDIANAVADGKLPSATYHMVYMGLAEGRRLNPYFNPIFYCQRHPQVSEEMRRLGIRTEIEHFLMLGKARGYKPEQPLVDTRPAIDTAKAIFQRRARRSYSNVTRRNLDFTRFSNDPVISIVVPVSNEVEFTARFLECAHFATVYLKYNNKIDCEIIIVDNGSTDGTNKLLSATAGLSVASFGEQIGFPRAINVGIGRARGSIIIVANNDIEFGPDVFVRVYERLMTNAEIGVLGGLTILPNETLQEAGSFLDSNAGVIGLGRNEDPWNEYFQGVHQADYCTGSFIAFRIEDYFAIGGFDESFSPGYYEETDFSFRLMKTLGKKAVVDSTIQVTHFEHASFGKGRPPTTAYALIRRNQARFFSKHYEMLSRRPSALALHGVTGARPITIGRTRMLVIEDQVPDSRLGSGFTRSSQILAALTHFGVAYDLLVLTPSAVVDDYKDPFVVLYRNWLPGEDFSTLVARQAGGYSHIMVCRTHNIVRFGGQLEALRHQYGFKLICDTEALSILRVLEIQKLAGRPSSEEARLDAIRLELTTPAHVSHWIAVNPYERDQIQAAGFGSVSILCHHFQRTPAKMLKSFEARRRVLMVGAIHETGSPNHDGLIWFMDRVYPLCCNDLADLQLTMVGYWHPDIVDYFSARFKGVKIDFAGVVSDNQLTRLYSEARLTLAPTRFAAGVASKVLQSMMYGVPIVMTDLLEMQLVGASKAGSAELAVGKRDDNGESFAGWVSRLATDGIAWTQVQTAQYDVAMPLASQSSFNDGVHDLIVAAGLQLDRAVGTTA